MRKDFSAKQLARRIFAGGRLSPRDASPPDRSSDAPLTRARHEEAQGNLAIATELCLEAGARSEAARLFALRAEVAARPSERLGLLAQAIQLADEEQALRFRLLRARLMVEHAETGQLVVAPSELALAGSELESLGEPELAARAHRLAGNVEGQARALAAAGAIEDLEAVLDGERAQLQKQREREAKYLRIHDLELCGRRRDALTQARHLVVSELPADERLLAVVHRIEARRVMGPRAGFTVEGSVLDVAFGETAVVGRSDVALIVGNPSVSRAHLEIRRGVDGSEAVDLGSRNGTLLGGVRVQAPIRVGSGIELELGEAARLHIEPWEGGGVLVHIGEEVIAAPLGPWRLGDWIIEPGSDQWIELRSLGTPIYLGELRAEQPIQLCRGDNFRERKDGSVRLAVAT